MKKHSDETLKDNLIDPQPLNTPEKPVVRYVGFESIEGGRRLRFCMKPVGHAWEEIAIEMSDAAFTNARGISIQDAAPMAYEKIVELLVNQGVVDSNELCLTDTDIAQYINRHLNSQKRASLKRDKRLESDIAA
jgi:hypothetical protein